MRSLPEIVQNEIPKKRVLIVGDIVADQFLRGTIARVSREAPVFILRHEDTETMGGGAANTAVNVASLGAEPILVGVIGTDVNGQLLRESLGFSNVSCDQVVFDRSFTTTTKVRVLAGQHYAPRQQVIRIDYENEVPIGEEVISMLVDRVLAAAVESDAIVLSDYNYGVANSRIFQACKNSASEHGIPLILDSRFRLADFAGATSATPNQEEVEQILGSGFSDEQCESLRERLDYKSLVVTRGNEGMLVLERGKPPFPIAAVGSKEPIDVTGAGDTVIAVYSLGLACGLSYREAAELANHAGGIVVMKKGTSSVTSEELIGSIQREMVYESESAASPL
jgi:rfaE bifunctional protein kinase chain/domain